MRGFLSGLCGLSQPARAGDVRRLDIYIYIYFYFYVLGCVGCVFVACFYLKNTTLYID